MLKSFILKQVGKTQYNLLTVQYGVVTWSIDGATCNIDQSAVFNNVLSETAGSILVSPRSVSWQHSLPFSIM